MTSNDELLKIAKWLRKNHSQSACDKIEQAEARIRELEAELDALKSDLSGYMDAANTYVNELHGVHAGTHVIVPVVADGEIYRAIREVIDDDGSADEVYCAMIRAAQPDAKPQQVG